jgi:small-conductance mechanosensitive channel
LNFDISQLESLLPKILGYGENILAAIVLFVVGRWFANKISGLGEVGMTRAKIDTTLRTFASNMIRYAVLTIVGLAILGRFGIETTSFDGSTIHNKSPGGERIAIAVTIGAAYDADLDQTRAVLTEYVNKIPGVLEGTGRCVLVGLGASSVDWSVRCVVHPDDYWSALELVHDHGKKALDTAGIGMPYTTMDVHIVSNPE